MIKQFVSMDEFIQPELVRQKLIDAVMDQIMEDIYSDLNPIEELISYLPTEKQLNYLSEKRYEDFLKSIQK